jgi:type IV pilus assembly protein PilQ
MKKSIFYYLILFSLLTASGYCAAHITPVSAATVRDPFVKKKFSTPSVKSNEAGATTIHSQELKITGISSPPHQSTTSENLSLNFDQIAVADLLELLAEHRGINLVISDAVKGNITVHLEHVTWEQGLNTVLTMQGLNQHREGSILFIAPPSTLQNFATQELQSQNLTTALIPTHYAKATDLAPLLQTKNHDLLSERGSVIADGRTNALWIKDTPKNLGQIRAFIQEIDIPAKQVSITARIINMDESSVEDLGLEFGTVTEGNSNHTAGQLHVDAPLTVGDIGHFTLAIAKLADNTLLDLELSALAREGHAQVISNPQLMTANQQPAVIESGQEIPYQEKTSSGATNTTFKKAVLSLKVTPLITPDNKILLTLAVNQDKVSTLTINGIPAINTQEIQTQVSVRNGETLVLGGIYEQSNSEVVERIPFWGSVPLMGALFSHKQTNHERKELLIFVTPSIVFPDS